MKTKAPASSSKGSGPAPRKAAAFVTQTDLKRAREDALLQLKIGRTAHYYSIVLWGLLFADGFLVTFSVVSSPNAIQSPAIRSLAFLYLPVAGTVLLSLFGLLVKWEAYQLWPWETHFSTNVAAVAVSAVILVLLGTRIAGVGPTGGLQLLPWFYPLVLAGSSLALVGLAMTWPGWSRRKAAAVAGAIAPIALALVGYIPFVTVTGRGLTLIASGSLYLFSGSLLHLMASGTEPHEAELVRTNQSRLFQLGEDIRRRTEALQFRESTVLRREADAEVAEGAAGRKLRAAEEVETQLRQLETDLDTRSARFTEEVKSSVQKIADASRALRDLQDREAEMKRREEEVSGAMAARKTRETALAQQEGELGRRKLELATREKELLARLQGVPPQEAALAERRKEIEQRMQELLRREADITSRTGARTSAASPGSKESAGRESRLKTMEATLTEQNALLGRRAREVDARESDAKRLLEEAASREQKLVSRESELMHREQELSVRVEAAQQRQKQFETALRNVQERARTMEQREAELTGHVQGAGRTQALLEARETSVRQQNEQLAALRAEIENRERVIAEKERRVGDRESEVSLRRQELESTSLAAIPAFGGHRDRDLEPEMGVGLRRVAPAEGSSPPPGLRPGPPPPATSTHAAPLHLPGRWGTGIPRVDDLLQGGFTPGAQVMLVGPPFLGKELLLYNFLAEGLRQSEPIILITTLRSPADVAQEIGLVLPQLREYEQLGQVHWIDASNPAATPVEADSRGPVKAVVKGPADYAGILAALAVAVKRASAKSEEGQFRVATLTLSASIAHGDERAAFGYLGNFVEILKRKKAVALYGVDPATLDAARVETALARMDGAIRFREERGKTQMQIQGLGEVATREWIEYRATNRTLNLGSFSLERIR